MIRAQIVAPWLKLVVALLTLAAWTATRAAEPSRHVVIISIDGLAAYLLDDPKSPLPTIRRLAREGGHVVGGMKTSNPSVTWPNHTTLVTGVRPEKHGVLANGVLVRGAPGVPVFTDPKKDKQDLVRVPTLFDVAHAAGLTTAEINWPCTRGAKSLDDSFPDVPEAVLHSTPRLRSELVAAGILADETDKSFGTSSVVGRDHWWTESACHVIRQRKPNLLLLHLLNVDSTHHTYGAQTPSSYTANAYADACVGRVLQALDEAGIRERTTVFVVADHGFALTPRAIRPNVLLRQEMLLTVGAGNKVTEARVNVVPEGGVGLVYCNEPGNVEALRKQAKELFTGKEGVAAVLEPAQFAEYGMPHPREYSQAPDLVIVAKDGYAVSAQAESDAFVATQVEGKVSLGSHGLITTNPQMNAICVISGRGIKAGSKVDKAENIDVAPTAARLLGLKTLAADGRVMSEILE
ncbi:MAG: alkaline phosphatase family protein [Planctomycetaceae bacterium]|nr:alkaline phosphatase family protein [Planctomycetaceae bacterium]